MPYLFWIDHVKARLKLVELVFSSNAYTQIYTLENFEDFIFRYQDLLPWAVVLDETQIPWDNSLLIDFFYKNNIKIIHVADVNEILRLQELSLGKISRHLEPMQLAESLKIFYLKTVDSGNFH